MRPLQPSEFAMMQDSARETRPGEMPGRHEKVAEIWRRLDAVTDPELDESVVDLAFVTAVEIDVNDHVRVGFRLPTYWCAANFAFMMADDMREATLDAPWVSGVTVVLGEHMYAETINTGVAAGRSFQDSFGSEADGNLDEVRRTFLLKAFQRRQEALLLHLLEAGYAAEALVAMPLSALEMFSNEAERRRLVARYLQRRVVAGPVISDALAFVTSAGDPLPVEGFDVYVNNLRRVRVNAEFNGALCRGLLAVRFDEPPTVPREPALM